VSLYARIVRRSVPGLVRLACVLALVALCLVCWSVLQPRPLPVILAMSAGHAIGGSAFACYLLAVILDAVQRPLPPGSEPVAPSISDAPGDSKKHQDSELSSQTTNSG